MSRFETPENEFLARRPRDCIEIGRKLERSILVCGKKIQIKTELDSLVKIKCHFLLIDFWWQSLEVLYFYIPKNICHISLLITFHFAWWIFQERHPYRWKVKHNLLRLSSISLLFNQLRGNKPGLKSSAKTWRQESRLRANWLWDDTLSTVGFEVTSPWNVKSKYEKSESENNRKNSDFFKWMMYFESTIWQEVNL